MFLSILKVVKLCKSVTNAELKYLTEFVVIFHDLHRNDGIIKSNFNGKSYVLKAQI